VHWLFKLFKLTIAATDDPYKLAIDMHESPLFTTYSIGGSGVNVGLSVGIRVSVGVGVIVTVSVGLGTAVLSGSLPVPFNVTNNDNAPTTKKTASNPRATGKLRVTSGIRAPWMDFSDFAFCFGVALNSLPHTTHRVEFSASRVPHVGQSLVGVVSGLMVRRLYHGENKGLKKWLELDCV
jgi:hypothetical protein